MSKEILKFIDKFRVVIIIGMAIFVVAVATILSMNQPDKPDATEAANTDLETSTIEVIKADLDVYYVNEGEYPYSYKALIDYSDKNKDTLINAKENIQDLEYTHRGDYQAYKITYTNNDGEKITVEGNYQDDYHE